MNEQRKNEIFEAPPAMVPVNTGGLTFETPVIDVPLPSCGRVYAADHPLHGKQSIEITAMTAAQENILTNRSLAKKGTILTHLIASCLRDRRIDARSLLIGDRNTIMVALRISGYGNEYEAKVICPACEEQSRQKFDLTQLPIRRLEIDPAIANSNLFEMILPMSKARVRFKFLTGADEEDVAVTASQKKKALGSDASASDLVTSGLMQALMSINGVEDRSQIQKALPKMPAFDSNSLRRYIQDNEPGMQLRSQMVCPSCDHTGEVDMPLGAGFFWPGAH